MTDIRNDDFERHNEEHQKEKQEEDVPVVACGNSENIAGDHVTFTENSNPVTQYDAHHTEKKASGMARLSILAKISKSTSPSSCICICFNDKKLKQRTRRKGRLRPLDHTGRRDH